MQKYYITILLTSFCFLLQVLAGDNIHGGTENGIVGKINDEYEVMPNGQFNYELSISTIAGTGGIAPHLSIVYNSSNKDGLAGHGFDLSGISRISRSPKNLYRDGKADVVRFNGTDRFSLDGIRLSLVDSISLDRREYRTENNSFLKIISEGDASNPSRFIVYTKDGLIREYKSLHEVFGSSGQSLYWLETKVSDTKGNYYTITYSGNVAYNEFRPSRIDYTGNDKAGLVPFASIRFSYIDSPRTSSYVSGEKVRQGSVISNISIYSGSQCVRNYEMTYSKVRSKFFLSKITESAGQEKKNPTCFTWNNTGTYSSMNTISSTSPDFKNCDVFLGDFDGDGKTDFLTRPNNNKKDFSYKLYLSKGNSFSVNDGQFSLPSTSSKYNKIYAIRSGDFNGDGYDDIIVERCWDSMFSLYLIDLYVSRMHNGYVTLEYSKTVASEIEGRHSMQVMDANCDGAADLFVYNGNYGMNSYLTLLSSSSEDGVHPLDSEFRSELPNDGWYWNVSFVDLDGDGTMEILNTHDNGITYLYSMFPSGELHYETGLSLKGTDYFCTGDFNNDGKTDVLVMGSSSDSKVGWEINFSEGFAAGKSIAFDSYPISKLYDPKDKQTYALDVNGDGYDDLYVVPKNTKSNKKVPIEIYINDGTGKTFTRYDGAEVYGTDKRMYKCGDFNGDGKSDLICYAKLKDSTPGYEVLLPDNSDNDMLSKVVDGLGNSVSIDYKRMTDSSVFKRGDNTEYPVVSVSASWPVVSQISYSNGVGGFLHKEYSYKNALYHKRGRGLLGFEEMTVVDEATNSVTTQTFEVLKQEMVPALKSVKTSIAGKTVKDVEYINQLQYQFNNGKKEVAYTFMPVCTKERSYEYNSGAIISEQTTEMQYDPYGNPTHIVTATGDKIITTDNTYSNDEDKWFLGRLVKSVVTKNNDKENITLTSEFGYDPESGLLVKESFEPDGQKGYVKVYEYDAYGNITKDIITPNDGSQKARLHETCYTPDGRFKVKSVDGMGFVTISEVNETLGLETATTDANGIVSTFKYNDFGELITAESPIASTITTTAWSNGDEHAPNYSLYYTKTQSTGKPTQWEYFDCLGRSLRKVVQGVNGQLIYTDAVYNSLGQLVATSMPYYAGEVTIWNKFVYDETGRILKQEDPLGNYIAYGYSGLTTTTHDKCQHSSQKQCNINGELIKSIDTDGNDVSYTYDVNGKCTEIKGPRTTIHIEYDKYGNKTKLTDPDLGVIEYEYNAFGELIRQTDAKGTTHFEYDNAGRLVEEVRPDFTYTNIYDSKWKGAISESSCSNGTKHEYFYDNYGRVTSEKETVGAESFTTETTYNHQNQVDVVTYPSGLRIKNVYSPEGYLTAVTSGNESNGKTYWQLGKMSAAGLTEQEILGNGVVSNFAYDKLGRQIGVQVGTLVDRSYTYDAIGNLLSRSDNKSSFVEDFSYDNLYRLTAVAENGNVVQQMQYDEAGNIVYKTGVGTIYYESQSNRISRVADGDYALPAWDKIDYTSFDKISSISRVSTDGSRAVRQWAELTYGPEKSRVMAEDKTEPVDEVSGNTSQTSTTLRAKYYVGGLYEKEVKNDKIREINYIFAGGKTVAIFETSTTDGDRLLYLHHDHIGSVIANSDEAGNLVEQLSYDAWGRRRDAGTNKYYDFSKNDITDFDQGFTGHEHIDWFDVVNMDGRMYDPVLGRFLSPDPLVQAPDMTQSLNRYAYCLNNPLTLTDPSGYSWIGDAFAVTVGVAISLETCGLASGWAGAAISGALGGATSAMLSSVINGANMWQTTKNTFVGAFWGAVNGYLDNQIGNIKNVYLRIAAHTISEGGVEGIRGGHIEHGMLVGFASSAGGSLIDKYGDNLSPVSKVAANAMLGGIVSEIGGGKFACGAMTGAFTMMFNEMMHPKKQAQMKKDIEKDGVLTFEEARKWYREGDGSPITVDADKIDLSFVDVSSIGMAPISVQTLGKGPQGFVYGGITIKYIGNNQVIIKKDTYNFEMHSWLKEPGRNIATLIARPIHGKGTPFDIYFRGVNTIHYNPHNAYKNYPSPYFCPLR